MAEYGWFGDYKSWDEALLDTQGYADDKIFDKTKKSIQEVVHGHATYERDTILFDKIEYEYHQASLAGLLKAALTIGQQTINVLDFGGSLGTLYFATKTFLSPVKLNWNIVEQDHYVKYGQEHLKCINFYYNLDDCLKEQKIDVAIFSSVLQYLEKPYEILDSVLSLNIQYVILDRTAVLPNEEKLTIQKVPPAIYESSYPAWFLNEEKLKSIFCGKGYEALADFSELWNCNILNSKFKGYVYVKRN